MKMNIQKQNQNHNQIKDIYSTNYNNNNYNNNNNISYERVLTPKTNFNFDINYNNNNFNFDNNYINNNKVNSNIHKKQNINRKSQSRTSNSSKDKDKDKDKNIDSIYLNSQNQKPQNYKTLKNVVRLSKEKNIRSKNSSFDKNLFPNNNNNSNSNNQTSVNDYLLRRHLESKEKIEQIKNNKFRDEVKELKDRPSISANSKKIVENFGNKNMNVFDRLTNNNNKKEMEIKKLEEFYNQNSNKPKVK